MRYTAARRIVHLGRSIVWLLRTDDRLHRSTSPWPPRSPDLFPIEHTWNMISHSLLMLFFEWVVQWSWMYVSYFIWRKVNHRVLTTSISQIFIYPRYTTTLEVFVYLDPMVCKQECNENKMSTRLFVLVAAIIMEFNWNLLNPERIFVGN